MDQIKKKANEYLIKNTAEDAHKNAMQCFYLSNENYWLEVANYIKNGEKTK